MSGKSIFNERRVDRFLPRKWQKLDDFAEYCDRLDIEEVEAGIKTRIQGAGPEARQKFRPVYRAEAGEEIIEYSGRESLQTWNIEFSQEPDSLFDTAKQASYDSWDRFVEDREFLEEEYDFETISFIP